MMATEEIPADFAGKESVRGSADKTLALSGLAVRTIVRGIPSATGRTAVDVGEIAHGDLL
jgi:hypothetical protein